MMMMNEPKRLHPTYILLFVIQAIKGWFPALIVLVVQGNKHPWLWTYAAPFLIGVNVCFGLVGWLRYSYTIEAEQIVIKKGVFFRDEKYISFRRIHTVSIEEPLIQRLFRVVKVKLETPGGGNEADGVIPAITRKEAEELQAALRKEKGSHSSASEEDGTAEIKILPEQTENHRAGARISLGTKDLLIAACTTTHLGIVITAVAGMLSFADDVLPEDVYKSMTSWIIHHLSGFTAIILAIIAGSLLAWVLSILFYIVKFGGYTVEKNGSQISISYGLLNKKQTAFHIHRVQAICVKEGWLRQWLGYAEVEVYVIQSDKKENVILHPFIKKAELTQLFEQFLPQYHESKISDRAPGRGAFYFVRWQLLATCLVSGLLLLVFGKHAILSLVLIPLDTLWFLFIYRTQGVMLSNEQLAIQTRDLARKTYYVRRPHIQSMTLSATAPIRRKGLLSLSIAVMGKSVRGIRLFEASQLEAVWNWYSRRSSTM
ncbi:PH domain-containing protein [Fictibacillus sp. Mic-4]|uniref:PH domain-containing protein n=1 Tax=Fictibacillus sp. Mic-4 TaxID=3132826 RepID=UPI003CEB0164